MVPYYEVNLGYDEVNLPYFEVMIPLFEVITPINLGYEPPIMRLMGLF